MPSARGARYGDYFTGHIESVFSGKQPVELSSLCDSNMKYSSIKVIGTGKPGSHTALANSLRLFQFV